MNREEAIKYGTEQLKDEYLDARDRAFIEIALKALDQMPVTTTAGEGGVIYYPQVEGVTPTVVDAGKQEPCEDAISRQASIDFINNHLPFRASNEVYDAYADCVHMLGDNKALPSVNLQSKTGQCIDGHCSKCGCDVPAYIVDWRWQKDMAAKFCPNCGAKMIDLQGEDEE